MGCSAAHCGCRQDDPSHGQQPRRSGQNHPALGAGQSQRRGLRRIVRPQRGRDAGDSAAEGDQALHQRRVSRRKCRDSLHNGSHDFENAF